MIKLWVAEKLGEVPDVPMLSWSATSKCVH